MHSLFCVYDDDEYQASGDVYGLLVHGYANGYDRLLFLRPDEYDGDDCRDDDANVCGLRVHGYVNADVDHEIK